MKFNGATFNKAQQDQLKKKVGAELDDVIKKIDDVDSRMLNYTGDWVTGNEYHENDVVTWAQDGHLYEVIKAHTSSESIKPDNTEYYKAMTANKYYSKSYRIANRESRNDLINDVTSALNANKRAFCYFDTVANGYKIRLDFNEVKTSSFYGVVGVGFHRDEAGLYPAIIMLFLTTESYDLSETTLSATGATKNSASAGSTIMVYYEA